MQTSLSSGISIKKLLFMSANLYEEKSSYTENYLTVYVEIDRLTWYWRVCATFLICFVLYFFQLYFSFFSS